jgi:hypothetical protein
MLSIHFTLSGFAPVPAPHEFTKVRVRVDAAAQRKAGAWWGIAGPVPPADWRLPIGFYSNQLPLLFIVLLKVSACGAEISASYRETPSIPAISD